MGKAIIKTNKGNGLYSVKVLYKNSGLKSRKKFVEDRIKQVAEELMTLKSSLAQLNSDLSTNVTTRNNAIVSGDDNLLNTAQNEINKQIKDINKLEFIIAAGNSELLSLKTELEILVLAEAKYINNPDQDAWCSEYDETLTGNVDTIELSDEHNPPNNQPIIIAPIPLPDARILTPAIDMAHDIWSFGYMFAATTAHQYNRPEYREANITFIDYDNNKANITFVKNKTALSFNGKQYPLNRFNSFKDVPIKYMNCDAKVFIVGDKVLVEFNRNNQTPLIVGFIDNPRLCENRGIIYTDTTGTRFIPTNSGGLVSLETGVSDFLAGTRSWTDGINYITYDGNQNIYKDGVLIYSAANKIIGCCFKTLAGEDILLILTTRISDLVLKITGEFYNLTTSTVLSSGVIMTYDTLYSTSIPINYDGTEFMVLSLSTAEAAAFPGNVADITTLTIDFQLSTISIVSISRNEVQSTSNSSSSTAYVLYASDNGVPTPGESESIVTSSSNGSFLDESGLVFSVGYSGNTPVFAKLINLIVGSNGTAHFEGANTPPGVFPFGVARITDSTTSRIELFSINGSVESVQSNVTTHAEFGNPGNLVTTSTVGDLITIDRIKILDLSVPSYIIYKSNVTELVIGTSRITL